MHEGFGITDSPFGGNVMARSIIALCCAVLVAGSLFAQNRTPLTQNRKDENFFRHLPLIEEEEPESTFDDATHTKSPGGNATASSTDQSTATISVSACRVRLIDVAELAADRGGILNYVASEGRLVRGSRRCDVRRGSAGNLPRQGRRLRRGQARVRASPHTARRAKTPPRPLRRAFPLAQATKPVRLGQQSPGHLLPKYRGVRFAVTPKNLLEYGHGLNIRILRGQGVTFRQERCSHRLLQDQGLIIPEARDDVFEDRGRLLPISQTFESSATSRSYLTCNLNHTIALVPK